MPTVSRATASKHAAVNVPYTLVETGELRSALAKIDAMFEATFSEIIVRDAAYRSSCSAPAFTRPKQYVQYVSNSSEAEESPSEDHYVADGEEGELEEAFEPLTLQRTDHSQLVRTVSVRFDPRVIQAKFGKPLLATPATPELHKPSHFSSTTPPVFHTASSSSEGLFPRTQSARLPLSERMQPPTPNSPVQRPVPPPIEIPPPILEARRMYVARRNPDAEALRLVNKTSFTPPPREGGARSLLDLLREPSEQTKKQRRNE